MDEVWSEQLRDEGGNDIGEQDHAFRNTGADEIERSREDNHVEDIVDEACDESAHCLLSHVRIIPNSQKAAHTLGSAPLNVCFNRSTKRGREEDGDPGSGKAMSPGHHLQSVIEDLSLLRLHD